MLCLEAYATLLTTSLPGPGQKCHRSHAQCLIMCSRQSDCRPLFLEAKNNALHPVMPLLAFFVGVRCCRRNSSAQAHLFEQDLRTVVSGCEIVASFRRGCCVQSQVSSDGRGSCTSDLAWKMSSQLSSSRHDSRMPFVPRRIFAAPGCQGNKQMEQPLLRKRASLDVVGALLQS